MIHKKIFAMWKYAANKGILQTASGVKKNIIIKTLTERIAACILDLIYSTPWRPRLTPYICYLKLFKPRFLTADCSMKN